MTFNSMRVHIIPIGRDKPERILVPLKNLKPDRVYLFTVRANDAYDETYEIIKKEIVMQKIVEKNEIFECKANYLDLNDFMGEVTTIIKKEQSLGNEVFYNISGGTMLTVVGVLSKLMFNVKLYFAKMSHQTFEVEKEQPFIMPRFRIEMPEENHVYILCLIQYYFQQKQKISISKGDLLDLIIKSEIDIELSGKDSKSYNKLKLILEKMKDRGYIDLGSGPKGEIFINEDGKFYAKVFGIHFGIDENELSKIVS